jgi:hypothetical protein
MFFVVFLGGGGVQEATVDSWMCAFRNEHIVRLCQKSKTCGKNVGHIMFNF